MKQLDLFIDVERTEIDTECVDLSKLICDIEPNTKQKLIMKNNMDLLSGVTEGRFIAYKTGAYHPNKLKYTEPVFPYVIDTHRGKEISIRLGRNQYPCLNIPTNTKQVSVLAHRLFCWCFINNPDVNVNIVVDHINNDKQDYRVENLEWVSQSENMRRNKQ